MLEIINERGDRMEFTKNMVLPIERNSSFFNENDELFLDVSYPGKAPLTAKNKKFFSGGHRLETDLDVYEFEVSIFSHGTIFLSGLLRYKYVQDSYDFTIKANYNAVSEKAKKFTFQDIYWGDAYMQPSVWNPATVRSIFENYMKETCENQFDHPVAYFPVKNSTAAQDSSFRGYSNFYDKSTQRFVITENSGGYAWVIDCPYFRLNYVLERTLSFLGFRLGNDEIINSDLRYKYLYNKRGANQRFKKNDDNLITLPIRSGMDFYLPPITLSDFLKAIKDRYHLCYDFDYASKKVAVYSFEDVYNSTGVIDISNYVEEIKEIEIPEEKGIGVSLKPDPTDNLYNITVNGEETPYPEKKLLVGDPIQKVVELNVGTLHQSADGDFSVVHAEQRADGFWNRDLEEEQLRVVVYKGMKTIGGVAYPESFQDEISTADQRYYNFLNNAKKVKVVANIPFNVISSIRLFHKIRFRSKEGTSVVGMLEKLNYDLEDSSLIKVEFLVRTINFTPNKYQIVPGFRPNEDEASGLNLVASFDPDKDGITQLYVEVWKTTFAPSTTVKVSEFTFTKPVDKYGTGDGDKFFANTFQGEAASWQVRVFGGNPTHLEGRSASWSNGYKSYFSDGPGYKVATVLNAIAYRIVF